MLKLEHIKTEVCPFCKSNIIGIRKYNLHINGKWNESVEFKCGYKIEFSPNFNTEMITRECSKNPKEIEKRKKVKIAIEKLHKYIKRLDVDDYYKNLILYSIKYI